MSTMTTASPFLHLAWKEYRTLRGLWLALATIGIGLQIVLVLMQGSRDAYAIAAWVSLFFLFSAAAIMFAAETEEGTDDLLRSFAVDGRAMLASKLAVAMTAAAGLLCLLLVTGSYLLLFVGSVPLLPSTLDVFRGLAMAAVLVSSALFFSMLTRSTLNAIWLAALVWFGMSTTGHLTEKWWPSKDPYFDLQGTLVVIYLTLGVVIFLVDVALVNRWTARGLSMPIPKRLSLAWLRGSMGRVRSPLWHLAWREMWMLATPLATILVLQVCLWGAMWLLPDVYWPLYVALASVALFGTIVLNVWSFHHDHVEAKYRFLSERGMSPFTPWLAKEYACLFASVVLLILPASDLEHLFWELRVPLSTVVLAAFSLWWIAIGAGQVAGIFVRNGALSFLAALFAFATVAQWLALMDDLSVPLWWSVWPIPFVLLRLTYLRWADLLGERSSWSTIRRGSRLVGVSSLVLLIAFASFRVRQIPYAPADVTPLPPIPTGAVETAGLYSKAIRALYPIRDDAAAGFNANHSWDDVPTEQRKWLAKNSIALTLAIIATSRPTCFFEAGQSLAVSGSVFINHSMEQLADLILLSAAELTAKGKLDTALSRYAAVLKMAEHAAMGGLFEQQLFGEKLRLEVRAAMAIWAAHPKQSAVNIRQAMQMVAEHYEAFPSLSETLRLANNFQEKRDWPGFFANATMRGYVSSLMPHFVPWSIRSNIGAQLYEGIAQGMPWERARARRLNRLILQTSIHSFTWLEDKLAEPTSSQFFGDYSISRILNEQGEAWVATTLGSWQLLPPNMPTLNQEVKRVADERMWTLMLACNGYRIENGEYPQRLEMLLSSWLREMPIDPYTGRLFGYFPEGFPKSIEFGNGSHPPIPGNRAALWTAGLMGLNIVPTSRNAEGEIELSIVDRYGNPFGKYYWSTMDEYFFVFGRTSSGE